MANFETVVHPLVLLSVADHYNRVASNTQRRVVGVLLGTRVRNKVDITNSFAVPFEEDLKDPSVWFLDHNYLETMFWMFKKVNSGEEIQGFYSSGPKLKANDLKICNLFRQFSGREPVLVIIDVRAGVERLPTTAYVAIEEVEADGKEIQRVFKHIPCSIEAEEAEEVGVEHLLRDINDPTTSTLALQVKQKISGLAGMAERLTEIRDYLTKVTSGQVPVNNKIIYNLQDIINLLPNLNVDVLVRSMLVKANDMHLVVYVSSLVRSVIALHSLLLNKIKYADVDDVLDRNAGVGVESPVKAPVADKKKGEKDKKATGSASPSASKRE